MINLIKTHMIRFVENQGSWYTLLKYNNSSVYASRLLFILKKFGLGQG